MVFTAGQTSSISADTIANIIGQLEHMPPGGDAYSLEQAEQVWAPAIANARARGVSERQIEAIFTRFNVRRRQSRFGQRP